MKLWRGWSHEKEKLKSETQKSMVTKSDFALILGFISGAGKWVTLNLIILIKAE